MKPWKTDTLCIALCATVSVSACALLGLPMPFSAHVAILIMASITVLALAGARVLMQRRAEDARLSYLRFANTLHEGVWMVDAAGHTVLANLRLSQMFGCDLASIQTGSLARFLGDNPPARLAALLDTTGLDAGRSHDMIFRRADGSVGWAIVSSRPAPAHAGRPGCLLLVTDISKRKAAELELASVKTGLEVRIGLRTAELRHANDQLRVQVRERAAAEQELASSYGQLRRLTAHLETAKEDERKRIALDIHDELGQNLLALKMDTQLLQARCTDPASQQHMAQALSTIDASIRSVRAIINDLHPSTLELGLPAATEWLVGQFRQRSGISCRLSMRGEDTAVPDVQRAAVIFRILRESLDHLVAFGRAHDVDVLLAIDERQVTVTISEDGGSFQLATPGADVPFLLGGLRERVDVFGGTLDMHTTWSGGTRLSFCIPLANRSDVDKIPA